jgi:hypothetical protein
LIVKSAGKNIPQNNENQGNIDNQSNQGNWNEKMKLTELGKRNQAYNESCCKDNCQQ